jgi:hypothetical protein
VILLHPGSSSFEGCVLPVPEYNLTHDGERKRVSTGTAVDESEDGLGGTSEVAHQPNTQAGLEFRWGVQVSA